MKTTCSLSFWLVQNLSEKGFPTSGNDSKKQQYVYTPKLSFEEFFNKKFINFTFCILIFNLSGGQYDQDNKFTKKTGSS